MRVATDSDTVDSPAQHPHLLAVEVIRTVPSRVTTADLERLSLRGVRTGQRSDPTGPAPTGVSVSGRSTPIEIGRIANRDGFVVVHGKSYSNTPKPVHCQ